MSRRSRPGPQGTSCLNCKQRHKKCDQRLPTCERCEVGGFECLGYSHNSTADSRDSSRWARPIFILPRPPSSSSGHPNEVILSQGALVEFEPVSAPSLASSVRVNPRKKTESPPSDNTEINASLQLLRTNSLAQSPIQSIPLTDGPTFAFQKLANLYCQSPRHYFDPLKIFLTSPSFDDYLMAQYIKLMGQWYFKPTNIQKQILDRPGGSHLQTSLSGYSRWIILISMGLCEAFITGDGSQGPLHGLWIEHIANTLKRELLDDSTSPKVQTRRRDWLHVSLLKTLVIINSDIYQVLQDVTPVFLQLVYSRPELWPNGSNPAYVPLMNVLNTGCRELAYFALIDCTCAMAFGLPHFVEYDTTLYEPGSPSIHQWGHGSPTEFLVLLAEINACRDQSPAARDWREIERWLLEWQSRSGEHTFTESWMTVAWYAVQESWRLALLVYLYLAVCNTSSDDLRIQTCVKQLLQVVGTVKKRESPTVEISFLVQYLIAGICVRSESQRKLISSTLEVTKRPKLWIMRGCDFLPVLNHLWHGAAADGRPVKWSDYV
ncbi:Acriflavine sensitivity control protein acr-2 [Neurospora crassa OR74A] [Rhizoctonia solani]|uniref:Acriflavine sensitivity control protein acr-2 [Neurospora crassa OR74A] n=1 Tax=Rhizoctonia solani TaxID=456999 RepID=A0A0K6G3T0_9AGAM|nr:Acriflavine sensitivity control protein acr-2 [Neurospora crassa OR74A] [Rhizoctonia solani]